MATHKFAARKRRHQRLRKRVIGTAERPRLVVTRSNRHMMAQVIDDAAGTTLAYASTLEADFPADIEGKIGAARVVGERIGKRAIEAGVSAVVLDRAGNKYHGRVAAVADGAREAGLNL
ncbi:50S ribosomal protein L18 [Trueperella pecoris]|uniref:Large ribosomal subunit protein uL18 n=1 Tax=Trueperella pecoris TaxID=2733571 RepID=A0A7M1QSK1_9ACTO|nr:50S ribosomal protein L18 [Trueperella pecoris]QOQ38379.1 50S ribosomal protein L18 [Trueperella pecoris]QOR45132.1 50S ribosomal protein L18 [Trueperella pecoris]QTG75038.1 50S ribosomal protein L18 [Trueperella pecoris]